MKKLKQASYLAAAILFSLSACEKSESVAVKEEKLPKTKPGNNNQVLWTDFMNDGFDTGWTQDVENGGSWWLQTSTGINWAIVHNTTPNVKGRAEVSRRLTYYTGVDKTVIVKGKFKLETTADGFTNTGGWILQTMAWSFTAPSGKKEYKPLVVARMLPNALEYLVYDYVWDAGGNPVVKSGFPIVRTVSAANMLGQTVELALTIKFSNTSTGSVRANLNGTNVTAANYDGITYPTIFPTANQQIQWKGGNYPSYPGTAHSKIGVFYLYTDQAQ
ncbi:hypothetical protein [Pedobacter glucosidilyticus]|uniref:hypothetical protein n=1 Tax=Pedobacter glucosidilyticus TaxID=1122941 RepID=UPI0026EA0E4E|nr:hypothetical protein [Pedobacter glucosidilyticus]